MIKRAFLYVIYEKFNHLDSWYDKLFEEFRKHGTYLLCVVNGSLDESSQATLNKFFDKVIYRDNKGYDVTAYKEGVLYILENNVNIDELVLCNNSFFAPIIPFEKMFSCMENKKCDFWGITAGHNPYHIQSYFYTFKKSVIYHKCFYDFFKNMSEIKHYQDAVNQVELKLTNYLHGNGFKSLVYMDMVTNGEYSSDQLSLIKNGCPLLKRRKIIYSKKYGYNHGLNNIGLFEYIKNNTNFNVEDIYINLLKEFPYEQIEYCINPNIIIDDENIIDKTYKIKFIISYNDSSKQFKEMIINKYMPLDNIEFIKTNSMNDIFKVIEEQENYDYYAHISFIKRDFLTDEVNFILLEHLFLSIYGTNGYSKNVCNFLDNNKYVGIVYPFEFIQGIKTNIIRNMEDEAYSIMIKNNQNIPKSKGINILSIDSSFIIAKSIQEKLKELNYDLGNGYKSFIAGGRLIKYLSQYYGLLMYKAGSNKVVSQTLSNFNYKINNSKLEDVIKSWWKSKKIKI